MYKGKRVAKRSAKVRMNSPKSLVTIAALSLVAMLAVGGTIAFLSDNTASIENVFTPGTVTTDIVEQFDGTTKSGIVIKNTGNTAAYVRVALVGNWCDADGNIVEAWDGSITLNDVNWVKSGKYYYYLGTVGAGESTQNLLGESLTGAIDNGLHLELVVLQQSVQATADASSAAWGMVYIGGTWSTANAG